MSYPSGQAVLPSCRITGEPGKTDEERGPETEEDSSETGRRSLETGKAKRAVEAESALGGPRLA